MRNIGFYLSKDTLRYEISIQNKDKYPISIDIQNRFTNIQKDLNEERNITEPILYYVTDEKGTHGIKWPFRDSMQNKYNAEYVMKKIQYLIPIKVFNEDFPNRTIISSIFWFEPSSELCNLLPKEIGNQIRAEYKYLTSEGNKQALTTSCTHF